MFYNEQAMSTEHNIRKVMERVLNEGTRITWWENCPFYKNKITSHHGPTVAIQFKHGVFVCCPVGSDKLVVRTVVRAFDPTKPLTFERK